MAAAALFVSGCGAEPPRAAAQPATHTVTIDGTRFEPGDLTVRAGDTVVFVNKDPFPHTATSRAGGFDSQAIDAGKSWRYQPDKPGDFPYLCSYHQTMTATLRVR